MKNRLDKELRTEIYSGDKVKFCKLHFFPIVVQSLTRAPRFMIVYLRHAWEPVRTKDPDLGPILLLIKLSTSASNAEEVQSDPAAGP